MASLFGNDFMQAVAALRISARQVAGGGRHAEHRSREMGHGLEFRDYRNYMPGDDVRHVDWNLFRRSGRLFLKLFEQVEDMPVYLMVDQSDSMYFESPPRSDAAKQIAGALAAVALGQHDRVGVYPFGDGLGEPLPSAGGKMAIPRVLSMLEHCGPLGVTNMVESLRQLQSMRLRSGVLMVVSDFYDHQGIDAVLEALGHVRHRLVLVQVVKPQDAEPGLAGEVRLVDCEEGYDVDASISARELKQYRQSYGAFVDKIEGFARRRQTILLRLNAEESVLNQLQSLFIDGLLAV